MGLAQVGHQEQTDEGGRHEGDELGQGVRQAGVLHPRGARCLDRQHLVVASHARVAEETTGYSVGGEVQAPVYAEGARSHHLGHLFVESRVFLGHSAIERRDWPAVGHLLRRSRVRHVLQCNCVDLPEYPCFQCNQGHAE